MRTMLRKSALIAVALLALLAASFDTSPANAQSRWHGGGGWRGGGWHGGWRGGGWGWGGYGWGLGTGLALGLGAPYYGGYYGYPAYGGCALRARWVIAPNGARVRRWVRVCY